MREIKDLIRGNYTFKLLEDRILPFYGLIKEVAMKDVEIGNCTYCDMDIKYRESCKTYYLDVYIVDKEKSYSKNILIDISEVEAKDVINSYKNI